MAKFTHTEYTEKVDSVQSSQNDKLNNQYQKFNDKTPVTCTYWNRSKASTQDDNDFTYTDMGDKSPDRYNKINNMVVYMDMQRLETAMQLGEFGREASSIEFPIYILPNTIVPTTIDCIRINQIKGDYIFKATDVSNDTFDNKQNYYKVDMQLDRTENDLDARTVEEYNFIIENQGTNYSPLIRVKDYNLARDYEKVNETLRGYYQELFYDRSVQSYVTKDGDYGFYDSYMTEFLLRNKVMEDRDINSIFIMQQVRLDKLFKINYDKSFYKMFEKRDIKMLPRITTSGYGVWIDDNFSLLNQQREYYFNIVYSKQEIYNPGTPDIQLLNGELYDKIKANELYNEEDSKAYRNIIIKYLNDEKFILSSKELSYIDNIDYSTKELYYELPLLIFIIDRNVENIISLTH